MNTSLLGLLAKLSDRQFGQLHFHWGLGERQNPNEFLLRKNIIQFDVATLLGELFELHERHIGVIQHGTDTRALPLTDPFLEAYFPTFNTRTK